MLVVYSNLFTVNKKFYATLTKFQLTTPAVDFGKEK